MLKKSLQWALIISTALFTAVPLAARTSEPEKLRKAVEKIGIHGDITVVRTDDRWFYGSVEQIDDTSFSIYEIEQKQTVNFTYVQVSKVYKGYGDGAAMRRDSRGHRIPPERRHTGWIVGGAILVTLVVLIAAGLKE